jgi:selenocysteine lyase/cysteine desulfurase
LLNIAGVTVQGISDPEAMSRRVPTVSFTHDRHSPDVIAQALAKRNIFVWSGHNYGVEPAKALGLLEGGGVVRVGAVHYNTADEIEQTLSAIEEIVA